MACPGPVLETKKALDALPDGGSVTVEVNTLSGRENCKRFAMSQGCTFTQEELPDGALRLVIVKGGSYVERPEESNPVEAMIVRERRNSVLVLVGALLTALLSASCCLVPTLFLVFGVSFAGVVNVPALEAYRGVSTAAAIGMLGYGLYRMVIKRRIECDCEPSLVSRSLTAAFWGLFVLSLAALTYPYYEGWLWGE